MKKKAVEKLEPLKPKSRKKTWITTVQYVENVAVMNVWKDRQLVGRQCVNKDTGEYAQFDPKHTDINGGWGCGKLINILGFDPWYYGRVEMRDRNTMDSPEEPAKLLTFLGKETSACFPSWTDIIDCIELEYGSNKRERAEMRRVDRVNSVMRLVPAIPKGFEDWIIEKAVGGENFAVHNEKTDMFSCTACGAQAPMESFRQPGGQLLPKFNKPCVCPNCNAVIRMKKRKQNLSFLTHACVMQYINDDISVARYFDVEIVCIPGHRMQAEPNEAVRVILFHSPDSKFIYDLYYNQYTREGHWGGYYWKNEATTFDNKSNPAHRGTFPCYLYPEGIKEALEDTEYERWIRPFQAMAAGDRPHHYNKAMARRSDKFAEIIEMLWKGRFYRMTDEAIAGVSYWSYANGLVYYSGPIDPAGDTIQEVFGLDDMQLINRLRDLDGGREVLEWLQFSESEEMKLPQQTLDWLIKNDVTRDRVRFIADRMSIFQIENYVKRQMAESYKGKSARAVLEQWADYLVIAGRLGKDTKDALTFKPRELKRRHDEAVEEQTRRQIELEMIANKEKAAKAAAEYRKKFPGGENILKKVTPKYSWENDDYIIKVPQNFVEIVAEGCALHHCAGSSDRYFDRIMQNETYIVFLRKKEEPDIPYYTIEVEPGGTIRQHRGMYDEEPDIETVKEALKEWQKEIRKRMSKLDHEQAKISEQKRILNIEDLKAKKNERVLKGLEEDFMEAFG